MNFLETVKSAIQNISSNKMRTLLTTLGIIIGISSVITITSLGTGFKEAMNSEFDKISGMAQVYMSGNSDNPATNKDFLNLSDVEVIKKVNGIKYSSAVYSGWGSETIKLLDATETKKVSSYGVNPDYYYMDDLKILHGRFISDNDITAKSNVVVIYDTTAKKVFGKVNAVGEKITMKGYFGNKKYTVIGILENDNAEMEALYGDNYAEQVFLPITTSMAMYGEKYVDYILIKVADKNNLASISSDVITAIEKSHSNVGKDMYYLYDPTGEIDMINNVLNMVTLFIGLVAAISLLVGGIGVMNIMMVTVTERTREIGIRKSLGAKNSDIRTQFIVEAIILTSIGGVLGIIFGLWAGNGIASLIPAESMGMEIKAVASPSAIAIAVGVSSLIGIIFGVAPANKAAKLDPIEALRYE